MAVCPWTTLKLVHVVLRLNGAAPVAVSGILWGLPAALSVMIRVSVAAPVADGVNVTLIVQDCDGASGFGDVGQLFVCENSFASTMLVISRSSPPVFVSVTGVGEPVTPRG